MNQEGLLALGYFSAYSRCIRCPPKKCLLSNYPLYSPETIACKLFNWLKFSFAALFWLTNKFWAFHQISSSVWWHFQGLSKSRFCRRKLFFFKGCISFWKSRRKCQEPSDRWTKILPKKIKRHRTQECWIWATSAKIL